MNKLTICQKVNILAGLQGALDSVDSVTGYQASLVAMVEQAYEDIQTFRENWSFMKGSVTIPLSTSVSTYSNSDISKVDRIVYDQSVLSEITHNDWILTDHSVAGEPQEFTVEPGGYGDGTDVITFNTLNGTYLPELYYFRVPHTMDTGADSPILPIQFHSLVIFKSLMDVGLYFGNYDVVSTYTTKYSIELGQMMRSQNPQITLNATPFIRGGVGF